MPKPLPMCFVWCLLLGAFATAQTTWNVPNQANLAPWIAQAAPGDVLVLGANHPVFSLTKGLTLRPASGRTQIGGGLFGPSQGTAINVPTGQTASLHGMDFLNFSMLQWTCLCGRVTANGTVHFEHCTFQSNFAPTFVAQGGNIVLRGCTATGGFQSTAMVVQGGRCCVVDCTLQGSGPYWSTTEAFPHSAMEISGGTVSISHSSLLPGASTVGSAAPVALGPVPGLAVSGGAVYLSDSTVRGGSWPGTTPASPLPWAGADAVVVAGGTLEHARCTLLPGSGTPPGQPTSGNALTMPSLVGISAPGALQLGTSFTTTAKAGVSGQALVFGGWFALAPNTLPPLVEPLWGDAATAAIGSVVFPAPGGTVPMTLAIPALPALRDMQLWLQVVQLDYPLVRGSAVVGGTIF